MIYSHCPRYNFPRFVPSIRSPLPSPLFSVFLPFSPTIFSYFIFISIDIERACAQVRLIAKRGMCPSCTCFIKHRNGGIHRPVTSCARAQQSAIDFLRIERQLKPETGSSQKGGGGRKESIDRCQTQFDRLSSQGEGR